MSPLDPDGRIRRYRWVFRLSPEESRDSFARRVVAAAVRVPAGREPEEELRLNRRFAPELYVEVVEIRGTPAA